MEQNKRLDDVEKYATEDHADRLNVAELKIDELQSSIDTLQARIEILEKNPGTSLFLFLSRWLFCFLTKCVFTTKINKLK